MPWYWKAVFSEWMSCIVCSFEPFHWFIVLASSVCKWVAQHIPWNLHELGFFPWSLIEIDAILTTRQHTHWSISSNGLSKKYERTNLTNKQCVYSCLSCRSNLRKSNKILLRQPVLSGRSTYTGTHSNGGPDHVPKGGRLHRVVSFFFFFFCGGKRWRAKRCEEHFSKQEANTLWQYKTKEPRSCCKQPHLPGGNSVGARTEHFEGVGCAPDRSWKRRSFWNGLCVWSWEDWKTNLQHRKSMEKQTDSEWTFLNIRARRFDASDYMFFFFFFFFKTFFFSNEGAMKKSFAP